VVATFNGGKITLGQLDDKVASQLMQVRRQGLDAAINETLLKAEAERRKLTPEQLTKAEVEDKVKEPTDADVKKLVEDAKKKGQLPEQVTLDQVRPQAVQFLKQKGKNERQQAFIAELRKKANVKLTSAMRMPVSARTQVAADGPSRGPNVAPVTLVEFSDFECPFCGKGRTIVEDVMKAYPGKIRLVFRQFPLENLHPHAEKAAEASLCANEQGKFWQFHDKLFDNREKLAIEDLKGYAKALGLNTSKFDQCLDSGQFTARVKADQEAGSKVGVSGTPAFFINGVNLSGAVPVEEFKQIIDLELASS
jgi:protein-disulfide isomerase